MKQETALPAWAETTVPMQECVITEMAHDAVNVAVVLLMALHERGDARYADILDHLGYARDQLAAMAGLHNDEDDDDAD